MNRKPWASTTHDWAAVVDANHLKAVRDDVQRLVPGGLLELICEVVAYANDEAEALERPGRCVVELSQDGAVSVADNGRGTDTRMDEDGSSIRKPVMATKDLRFFDSAAPPALPDGSLRRGMSVVAALSPWLVHTNRRREGSWTQRYEYGIPMTSLTQLPASDTTGTTVTFHIDNKLVAQAEVTASAVTEVAGRFTHLEVIVRHVPA